MFPLISIMSTLFIILFVGCYRLPPKEKYAFYTKHSEDEQLPILNRLYYFNERDDNGHISTYTLKFMKQGEVYFQAWGSSDNDTSLIPIIRIMQKDLNTKQFKKRLGYYKIISNHIELEIIDGYPMDGYFFIYYKGEILSNGLILLSQSNIRKYRHPKKKGIAIYGEKRFPDSTIFRYITVEW